MTENFISPMNYNRMATDLKSHLKSEISSGKLNTFITLNPNKFCNNRNKLESLFNEFDKMIRGRVMKRKLSTLYQGYGFIELGKDLDTPHLHALVHIPDGHFERFNDRATDIWRMAHPFGSSEIVQINPDTAGSMVDYVFKEESRNFYDTNRKDFERLIVIARPQ